MGLGGQKRPFLLFDTLQPRGRSGLLGSLYPLDATHTPFPRSGLVLGCPVPTRPAGLGSLPKEAFLSPAAPLSPGGWSPSLGSPPAVSPQGRTPGALCGQGPWESRLLQPALGDNGRSRNGSVPHRTVGLRLPGRGHRAQIACALYSNPFGAPGNADSHRPTMTDVPVF